MIAVLGLLRRFWPVLAIGGLLLAAWLYIGHVDSSARAEQKHDDAEAVEKVEQDRKIADLSHALATERAQTAITERKNDELATDLSDARTRAAAYVERMRTRTAQALGGGADMSGSSAGSGLADGADQDTIVPVADIDVCTENTVRLQNAQAWLNDQRKVPK